MFTIYGKKPGEEVPYGQACDFVLELGEERRGSEIRLLQLTDMQIIDATQRRTPDRLRADEIAAWDRQNIDAQCNSQIRSLVTQTNPDIIFITGDVVYGSFDDSGEVQEEFIRFMDSFQIPWTLTYGNHDNESAIGIERQCELYVEGEYCMFKRGNVTGNSNFTVGISCGGKLERVLYMIDSNVPFVEDETGVRKRMFGKDQLAMLEERAAVLKDITGELVPGFMAFHIPVDCFLEAEESKGYGSGIDCKYIIGVDVPARDGDFGFRLEKNKPIATDGHFKELMHKCGIDGVFVGHCHSIATCITYDDIKWVFGLKTGQYDYHVPGQLGGTIMVSKGGLTNFTVQHVPALVPMGGFPGGAGMWRDFWAKTEE